MNYLKQLAKRIKRLFEIDRTENDYLKKNYIVGGHNSGPREKDPAHNRRRK